MQREILEMFRFHIHPRKSLKKDTNLLLVWYFDPLFHNDWTLHGGTAKSVHLRLMKSVLLLFPGSSVTGGQVKGVPSWRDPVPYGLR